MKHAPTWVLSLLDPNPFGDNIQLGFSWIYEALDSGCSGTKCVEIASSALKLLGKRFYSWSSYTGEECLDSFPLTKALLLSGKFYSKVSPPYSGYVTLRFYRPVEVTPISAQNTPPGLHIEVPADLPSAVTLFGSEDQDLPHFRIRVVSKMENVSDKDRGNVLEATRRSVPDQPGPASTRLDTPVSIKDP